MRKIVTILIIISLIAISQSALCSPSPEIENKNIINAGDKFSEAKIKLFMKIGRIPSMSACIIDNNGIEFYKGMGSLNRFKKIEPTKDTIYQLGSITKTVTGIAVMQLWEKGLFDLDDDINDYLNFSIRHPKYPDIPITFRMLLAHQAGFHPADTSFFDLRDEIIWHFFSNENLNKFIEYPYPWIKEFVVPGGKLYKDSVWLDTAPGEKASYSNIQYIILEHLIERLTEQDFEEYCRENIFEPLHMCNTSFHYSNHKKEQLAPPYFNFLGFNLRFPHYDFGVTGGGGLRSSVEDLSHLLTAHMNGGVWNGTRILNETTIEMMHTKQYPNSLDEGYDNYHGLAWEIFSEEWQGMILEGHSGIILGGSGVMYMNQTSNFGVIVLLNKLVLGLICELSFYKIFDEFYNLYLKETEK